MFTFSQKALLTDLLLIQIDRLEYLNAIPERVWHQYESLESDYVSTKKYCQNLYSQILALLSNKKRKDFFPGALYNRWKSSVDELIPQNKVWPIELLPELEHETINAYKLAISLSKDEKELHDLLVEQLQHIKTKSYAFKGIKLMPIKYK